MNPKELVEKTLNFDSPERIPRQLWLLPWAEETYPADLKKYGNLYPDDIYTAPAVYKKTINTIGDRYSPGEYTDEWGCVFVSVHSGIIGIVKDPLIKDWADLAKLKTPDSTLFVDKDEVNAFCRNTDRFVLGGTFVRPFERYQFLRTMENAMIDMLTEPPELSLLLNTLHNHYCKEVEEWARTDVDAITLMDDWGMDTRLLVAPEIFRKYFKPMYREYVEIARHYGKYVFMHSDGHITEIIPDLIEVGIDALNSQIFCMDIKELGELFRGKITFWGEIDRQHLLPKGSSEDIKDAVYKVYNNLYAGGGIIAQCEFGPGANPDNIFKVFETWNEISKNLK